MAKINIVTQGRFGKIQYIEGSLFKKNVCEFYWEFGGGDAVAIIAFPKSDAEWDTHYPWAAGRRMEIVTDMAERVRKKKSPTSTLRWEEGSVVLVSGK
ncbi:MAG: hypothetical protein IT314_17540 [Anaerolineales bacterium]|nr:hypothetical protein [Anaerolineales bacterium]